MRKKTLDRRTEKTRKALKVALIQLLQTRSLQKISIAEIAKLADISRGTFYLHYRNIFDLYQAVESEVVEGMAAIISRPSPVKDEDALERMVNAIFKYLVDNFDACEALLRTDSASFLSHAFERNRPQSEEVWNSLYGRDKLMRSYSYVFISYGCAGMLKHWMDTGKREPINEIADIVKHLLNYFLVIEPEAAKLSAEETQP